MAGDDRYFGGAGIDTLDYSASTEGIAVSLITTVPQLISTGNGADVLNSIENLVGSQFNDNISGNLPGNKLSGLGGADSLSGRHGNDVIDGGDGDDKLLGGNGDDTLLGGAGNDSVFGGIGNDRFIGDMAGDDRYFGGEGVDTLDYSESIDPITVNLVKTAAQHISTGSGTDTLNSIEYLVGSRFSDILIGNTAANRLNGGLGNDMLSGGAGADRFVFDTAINIDNIDTLTDFSVGEDFIVLSAGIFTAYAGQVGQTVGLSINFSYDSGSGTLSYDADGAGEGAAVDIAIIGLSGHPAILGNDFLIIA
jgi:Ca2+-binding RTX toxin-like protein